MSEIRKAAAEGYDSVKDAIADFDWRDEVKKRPVAWSLGALSAGLLAGYGIAGAIKGTRGNQKERERDYVPSEPHAYPAQTIRGEPYSSATKERKPGSVRVEAEKRRTPGATEEFKESGASDRVRRELASLRDRFIDEVSSIAHQVLLPALMRKIREAISDNVSAKHALGTQPRRVGVSPGGQKARPAEPGSRSTYQPVLERDES